MSNRPALKSAFENLRPTIIREPKRSPVSNDAEERLLTTTPERSAVPQPSNIPEKPRAATQEEATPLANGFPKTPLLQKKKRETLLLVSFRCPQGLKEKLERVAKKHEINQTDIINEAIEMNLQRYL